MSRLGTSCVGEVIEYIACRLCSERARLFDADLMDGGAMGLAVCEASHVLHSITTRFSATVSNSCWMGGPGRTGELA